MSIGSVGSVGYQSMQGIYQQRQRPPEMTDEKKQEMFNKTDTDGSGGLSLQELSEGMSAGPKGSNASAGTEDTMKEAFAAADADGDGELSLEEMDTFAESMHSKMPPPPQQQGSGQASQMQDLTNQLLEILNSSDEEDESTYSIKTKIQEILQAAYGIQGQTGAESGTSILV